MYTNRHEYFLLNFHKWLSRWNDTDVHAVSVPLLHRGDASAKNTMKNTWGEASPGASSPPWESYAIHQRYHWSDMSGIVWSETTGIIWVRTSVSFGRYYHIKNYWWGFVGFCGNGCVYKQKETREMHLFLFLRKVLQSELVYLEAVPYCKDKEMLFGVMQSLSS